MTRVLLLEPYFTGSHRTWALGLKQHSKHTIDFLTLPGRFWKWRMHGAAITLARMALELPHRYDVIFATDMIDLASFLAHARHRFGRTPTTIYFHENQLTYPPPPGSKRDLHYGFINYNSALIADRVLFNSHFHRRVFIEELPRLLKHFPDFNNLETIAEISDKSRVLPVGMDYSTLETARIADAPGGPARILWNHRWEYDKQPDVFFEALYALQEGGSAFEVIILGESFRNQPEEFLEAQRRLHDHIRHWGYTESRQRYAEQLWEADIHVSCAIQEFFGISTLEALYAGCTPLLPNRLTYPELLPVAYHPNHLYDGFDPFVSKLRNMVAEVEETRGFSLHEVARQYEWQKVIHKYDEMIDDLA